MLSMPRKTMKTKYLVTHRFYESLNYTTVNPGLNYFCKRIFTETKDSELHTNLFPLLFAKTKMYQCVGIRCRCAGNFFDFYITHQMETVYSSSFYSCINKTKRKLTDVRNRCLRIILHIISFNNNEYSLGKLAR